MKTMGIFEIDLTQPGKQRDITLEDLRRLMRADIEKIVVKGRVDDCNEDLKHALTMLEQHGHRIEYVG